MRTHYCVLISIIILLINPLNIYGYYIIQMKNGRQFSTSYYWEEDDRIMFYINNGVIGLTREYVKNIVNSDSVKYDKYTEVSHKDFNIDKHYNTNTDYKENREQDKKFIKSSIKDTTDNKSQYNNENDEYIIELDILKENLKNIHLMTTEDIYKFSARLSAYKKKIIDNELTNIYADQFSEAYLIGDEMERILKTRIQSDI